MRVFVCEGMGLAKNQNINKQARLLGEMLAKKGVTLVQGGTTQGLMGETLKSFLKYSDDVEFFIPQNYYVENMQELRAAMPGKKINATKTHDESGRLNAIKGCDQAIIFPGGMGTLEECLFMNETSRAREHGCKLTIVNVDGFFDFFLKQVERNIQEGLAKLDALRFDIVGSVDELALKIEEKC